MDVYEAREVAASEASHRLTDLVLKEFEALIEQYSPAPLLAGVREVVLRSVEDALDNKRVYLLCHPYPADARRMLAAIQSVL